MFDTAQYCLGAASGGLIGLSLSLFGGGGSILAVPMMMYVVRVANPHVAVGTSALAVAANAAVGLATHGRAGTVQWRIGLCFAAAGMVGALAGSTLGKRFDGQHLLLLFAMLMLFVGAKMLGRSRADPTTGRRSLRDCLPQVVACGAGTGLLSGFFGIGGGFLIVPGLIAATGIPMVSAVGTSLIAVAGFGLVTALNYAFSQWVDWRLALCMVAGGLIGNRFGAMLCNCLGRRNKLRPAFAMMIFAVSIGMIWKSLYH